jgi:poly(3-hydroxybutyrate) depolymerase
MNGSFLRTLAVLAAFAAAAAPARAQQAPPGPPRTGSWNDTLKDPAGAAIIKYQIAVPKTLPEKRHLGLIVQFHGSGGDETNLQGGVLESLGRLGVASQYIVVGGKSKGGRWERSDDDPVFKMIDWVQATYPVDARRVFMTGYSAGGFTSSRLAAEHMDRIAGAAPYAGYGAHFGGAVRGGTRGASPADTKTEFYIVHGDKDETVKVDNSRGGARDLKSRGYRYVYREVAGADHGNLWGRSDVRDDSIAWMHALRHKEVQLPADDRKSLNAIADHIRAGDAAAAPDAAVELARIGGAAAGRVVALAARSSSAEWRLAAATAGERTLFGREAVVEMARLLTDRDERVRTAALKALGTAAAWRYEEAQAALVKFASNKAGAVEDRLLAVAGLARALKLAFLGNLEDPLPPGGLVQLLNDDEQRVREAAFAPLAAAVSGGYGYTPDLNAEARRAPLAQWKTWLTGPCEALNHVGGTEKARR